MKKHVPPRLQKFPAAKQRRLDQLLEKNSEGPIAAKEKSILERLVKDAEQLAIDNAKRLLEFAKNEGAHAPEKAVPVTVWVQPHRAEQ